MSEAPSKSLVFFIGLVIAGGLAGATGARALPAQAPLSRGATSPGLGQILPNPARSDGDKMEGCRLAPVCSQDLAFLTPDGQSVSISSMRGKVSLLFFGGVQDPQCRDGLKALQSVADRFQGKPVGVYWISVNAKSELSDQQLRNPCGGPGSVVTLRDPTQAGFRKYSGRVAQLPTIVILDRAGAAQGKPRGGFNPNSDFVNEMAAVIERLLKQS